MNLQFVILGVLKMEFIAVHRLDQKGGDQMKETS